MQAAAICERVLQEQDGTASVIRLIDRVTFISDQDGRPLFPKQAIWLFIALESGAARGCYAITVVCIPCPTDDEIRDKPVTNAPVSSGFDRSGAV